MNSLSFLHQRAGVSASTRQHPEQFRSSIRRSPRPPSARAWCPLFLLSLLGLFQCDWAIAVQEPTAESNPAPPSATAMPSTAGNEQPAVDFSRDVRPILADTCFKCHGPDGSTREAGLRLDTEEGVFEDGEVVTPGELDDSELYQRIISEDPDLLMPPPDSGRVLTAEQIETLRTWISQGAKWSRHWSLEPIDNPAVPDTTQSGVAWPQDWVTNEIDQFVAARLIDENLQPAAAADRRTLGRRVYLDLVGMPPTPEELQAFLDDKQPGAYRRLVDRLLADPRYGEHMARYWLDAARYGDTHGLHLDNYREMWPYRDWVIQAFNENKSYKQFTIEQLAGDLLPEASDAQKIASGFNRAHVDDQRRRLDRRRSLRPQCHRPRRHHRHRVYGANNRMRLLPRP